MISKRFFLTALATTLGLLSGASTLAHAAQIRVLGWAPSDGDLQVELNKQPTRLNIFSDTFSSVIDFGAGPIVFYKMVDHEGAPKKQIACTVTIPAGQQRGLLLLVPGNQTKALSKKVLPNESGFISAEAPLIYDYLWLDDSLAARPSGTLEFRNLSRFPIALQIAGQQLALAPREHAQVPLTKGAKRMAFKAAAQVNGTWRIFASNPLPTRNPDRMLVILRDGPARPSDVSTPDEPDIRLILLHDWPPPVPATPGRETAAR